MKELFLIYARDSTENLLCELSVHRQEKPFAVQGRQILTETTMGFA